MEIDLRFIKCLVIKREFIKTGKYKIIEIFIFTFQITQKSSSEAFASE
jgi:hypothetical protein